MFRYTCSRLYLDIEVCCDATCTLLRSVISLDEGLVQIWIIWSTHTPLFCRRPFLSIHSSWAVKELLPPATKLRQGNGFTRVCHPVHRGCLPLVPGGCLPHTPLCRQPHPWADTPPAQCMLGSGQQAGGTHSTGMHSCPSLNLNGRDRLLRGQRCKYNRINKIPMKTSSHKSRILRTRRNLDNAKAATLKLHQANFICSVGSKISRVGGRVNPRVWAENLLFNQMFAKNCMKMK